VLGLNPLSQLEPTQFFFQMGMDSLMAVDLKNCLELSVNCSLPATLVFEYPTSEALAGYLERKIFAGRESGVEPEKDTDEQTALLEKIKLLSEEEVEALITEELATLRKSR